MAKFEWWKSVVWVTGIFFQNKLFKFQEWRKTILLFFAPFVFFPDLFLFAGGEVVLDVEGLANVFRGLALDHVCHGLACDVKQPLEKRFNVGLFVSKLWIQDWSGFFIALIFMSGLCLCMLTQSSGWSSSWEKVFMVLRPLPNCQVKDRSLVIKCLY